MVNINSFCRGVAQRICLSHTAPLVGVCSGNGRCADTGVANRHGAVIPYGQGESYRFGQGRLIFSNFGDNTKGARVCNSVCVVHQDNVDLHLGIFTEYPFLYSAENKHIDRVLIPYFFILI